MNIVQAKEVIKIARDSNDTVLMQGKHGIGKSTIVQQYCNENDYHLEELFLSNQEVGDLIGHPTTEIVNGVSIQFWSVPVWLHRMQEAHKQGKHCVLHLDELNRAEPDVLQCALQLVLEGKIHEHSLPVLNGQKTFIVASTNPAFDDYDVRELDPALEDRFLVINVEADLGVFVDYAKENNLNKLIIEFLEFNPEFLHYTSKTFRGATPRSWAKFSQYLDGLHELDDSTRFEVIQGKIGYDAAVEFSIFLESAEKIDIAGIQELVNSNIDSVQDFNQLGSIIQNELINVEPIHINKLFWGLVSIFMKSNSKNDATTLLSYMYALSIELLIPLMSEFKHSPKFKTIVKLDDELMNKELFKRLV